MGSFLGEQSNTSQQSKFQMMYFFCRFTHLGNEWLVGSRQWRDILTGFPNINQIHLIWDTHIFFISSDVLLRFFFSLWFLCFLASIVLINTHVEYLLCLVLFCSSLYVCYPPTSVYHLYVSISPGANITCYLYLVLFYSIIPSFLFTGPSPFPTSFIFLFTFLIAPKISNASDGYRFPFFPVALSLPVFSVPVLYPTINTDLYHCWEQAEEGQRRCLGERDYARGEITVTIRWSARIQGWIVNKEELLRWN